MNNNTSQMQIGQLLKDALTYAGPIYVPMLTFSFPSFIISLLGLGMTPGATVLMAVINLLGILPFVTGAAIFYVHQNLTNRGATIPESLQASGERFVQLVLLTFIFYIFLITGYILLVLPGIYLSIRLSFVYYALMIEQRSAFDSISRSWQLTRGHWWKLFRALLVLFLAVFVPAFVVLVISALIDPGGADIGGAFIGLLIGPFVWVYYTFLFMRFINFTDDDVYERR